MGPDPLRSKTAWSGYVFMRQYVWKSVFYINGRQPCHGSRNIMTHLTNLRHTCYFRMCSGNVSFQIVREKVSGDFCVCVFDWRVKLFYHL